MQGRRCQRTRSGERRPTPSALGGNRSSRLATRFVAAGGRCEHRRSRRISRQRHLRTVGGHCHLAHVHIAHAHVAHSSASHHRRRLLPRRGGAAVQLASRLEQALGGAEEIAGRSPSGHDENQEHQTSRKRRSMTHGCIVPHSVRDELSRITQPGDDGICSHCQYWSTPQIPDRRTRRRPSYMIGWPACR